VELEVEDDETLTHDVRSEKISTVEVATVAVPPNRTGTVGVPYDVSVYLAAIKNPHDADWPGDQPEWELEKPSGSDASLEVGPEGFGDEIALLTGIDTPGDYVVEATCEATDGCDPGDNTITITPVFVSTWPPTYRLWYFVDDSHESITVTADGNPSGGTYEWDISEGSDKVHIVEGEDTASVTVRADAPSTTIFDVELTCTYTYAGCSVSTTPDLTVLTPDETGSSAGRIRESGQGPVRRIYRDYYHEVENQLDVAECIPEGVQADEDVDVVSGTSGWQKTGPGPTGNHPSDGAWGGGVCVRDYLGCSMTHAYSTYNQKLYVGGMKTDSEAYVSPDYLIILDPAAMVGDDRLSKESRE